MKQKQLSLFLENKPGHVRRAFRILSSHGINIEAMSLADTEQFGILRLLVKEWEEAQKAFEQNGVIVRVTDVVAVVVPHSAGGLATVLDCLDEVDLNIEYMYGFLSRAANLKNDDSENAIIVFRFDSPDVAIEQLTKGGIKVLQGDELFA
ncbi:MAG: hypothetical protein ACRCUY_01560 [Thermoguttaceae bacterium]